MAQHDDPPDTACDVAAAAQAVAAPDLFLFRRVSAGRFLHLGGEGRGTGWAGLVELSLEEVPAAAEAIACDAPRWIGDEPGAPAATSTASEGESGPAPVHVLGPYYAANAVFVALSADVIAVFGWPHGLQGRRPEPGLLRSAAATAAEAIDHVSPAKRLGDELELLHAVKAMLQCDAVTVDAAARHVVTTASEALSCEVGVLQLGDDRVTVIARGRAATSDEAAVRRATKVLWDRRDELPLCVQDAAAQPLDSPLGPDDGTVAYYAVPIGQPPQGLLLLAHTAVGPRGFTSLCRELGLRLAEAAESVLRNALLQEELQAQIDQITRDAAIDPLTGLGNRRAFEESLDEARASLARGEPASVIVVDVNSLKRANDTRGHDFGDQVLRRVADAVRAVVGPCDRPSRVGGDELAVVAPGAGEAACSRLAQRLRHELAGIGELDGFPVGAALGQATCRPFGDLDACLAAADARMYDGKPTAAHGGHAQPDPRPTAVAAEP